MRKPRKPSSTPPLYPVGTKLDLNWFGRPLALEVVEDRGPIGKEGRRLLLVRLESGTEWEMPEVELTRAQQKDWWKQPPPLVAELEKLVHDWALGPYRPVLDADNRVQAAMNRAAQRCSSELRAVLERHRGKG